jgi:hypothetical protein
MRKQAWQEFNTFLATKKKIKKELILTIKICKKVKLFLTTVDLIGKIKKQKNILKKEKS